MSVPVDTATSEQATRTIAPAWHFWRRPLRTIVVLVLACAVYAAVTGGRLPVPGRTGGFVVVAGHSMDPTLATGDLVGYTDAPAYRVGDIVVFDHPEPPHKAVIHRVVTVTPQGYVTRGDNRPTTDGNAVAPAHVHGRLAWRLPRIGYAIVVLQGALHVLFGTIGGWCMLAGAALAVAAVRLHDADA